MTACLEASHAKANRVERFFREATHSTWASYPTAYRCSGCRDGRRQSWIRHAGSKDVVSDIAFMRLEDAVVRSAGIVSMQDAPAAGDCRESCYDWYGNARLFFVGDRAFALSANLLKEARYRAGVVSEIRRVELP